MPIVTSDAWTVSLPDDWEQKETTESGSLCFECADGSKGLFVTTWDLGTEVGKPPTEVATAFQRMSAVALDNMDGYTWKVVDERTIASDRTSAILVSDHVAPANSYRIVTKILARPPLVIRASFHDYLCDDYAASLGYFTPILESLVLK
jgi:hypothetical protein